MDVGSNAEWLTLSERLATIVHNPEHPIGSQFLEFTNRVKVKCEAIKKTVESIVNSPTNKLDRYLDYYVITEEDVKVDKVVLEDMRMEILLHLLKMSDLLIDFFKNCNKVFLNKVRLSYEKCFFNKVGDCLVELYRLVHGTTMKSLENRIKCVREYPICQLGLQMKDEWWLSLLDHKTMSGNYSSVSAEMVNGVVDTDSVGEDSFPGDIGSRMQQTFRHFKDKIVSKSTGNLASQDKMVAGRLEFGGIPEQEESRARAFTTHGFEDETDNPDDKGIFLHDIDFVNDEKNATSVLNLTEADSTIKGVKFKSADSDTTDEASGAVDILCRNLQSSKDKVLSRSSGNLLSSGLTNTHDHRREAEEMEQEIESRGRAMTSIGIAETGETAGTSGKSSDGVQPSGGSCTDGLKDTSRSMSSSDLENATFRNKSLRRLSRRRPSHRDTFRVHFGPTIKSMRNIFDSHSPLMKMQCLTAALKLVVDKVVELRLRDIDADNVDRSKVAVSADDLLPLIVLLLLKLEPVEVGLLFVELIYISDLMAEFLAAGCHSYALTEFQIAFRVLDQTCEELDI